MYLMGCVLRDSQASAEEGVAVRLYAADKHITLQHKISPISEHHACAEN